MGDQGHLEGVAVGEVGVPAVLHQVARGVERRPGHREDGGGPRGLQQLDLLRGRAPGADHLLTRVQLDALAAQRLVQARLLQRVFRPAGQQPGRQVVVHDRQRGPVGQPQPLQKEQRGAGGQPQDRGELVVGADLAGGQHRGGRMPAADGQVVVQAGQRHRAEDARRRDHGAQATAPDHQALLDQALHRLPDRGTAHAQAFGQVQLVVQPVARFERPFVDGPLEVLGDLEVQRDRAVAVERPFGHGASPGCRLAGEYRGPGRYQQYKQGSQLSLYCPDLLTYY